MLLMLYLDFSELLVKCAYFAVLLTYLNLQNLYLCLILLGDIRYFQSYASSDFAYGPHKINLIFILEER